MRFLSIRGKLILLIVIILMPLLIFQYILIQTELKYRTESVLSMNVDMAQAISKSLLAYIQDVWVQEMYISKHITGTPNMTTEDMRNYLLEVLKENEAIVRLNWVNTDGIVVASSAANLIDKYLSYRDYFQQIKNGEGKVVSNLTVSVLNKELVIPVARGIKKDGKWIGVMVAIIDLNKFTAGFMHMNLRQGDVFGFVDKEGKIVYQNDYKTMTIDQRTMPKDATIWRALKGEIVKSNGKSIYRNSKAITVEYPIQELGWACFVSSSRDVVLKDSYKNAKLTFLTLILVCLFSLGVALLLAEHIIRSLNTLKTVADNIIQGNLKVRANLAGQDELSKTAKAIDIMAQSIEQYDRLKMQFFTNISHELRTPLNVILASVQLLDFLTKKLKQEETVMPKVTRNIAIIKQNSYRLLRLINNLIDLSRLDSGALKLNLELHDIVSMIKEITTSVSQYAELLHLKLTFETNVDAQWIVCDGMRIERIILNLLSNAFKFTEAGGSITIKIEDLENSVKISVKDTGIGISKEKQKIIFERFRQVDESFVRAHEGSGIGLSIVKMLAEAHLGSVMVKSELGQGAEFTIELPHTETLKIYTDRPHQDINMTELLNIELSDIYEITGQREKAHG